MTVNGTFAGFFFSNVVATWRCRDRMIALKCFINEIRIINDLNNDLNNVFFL